MKKYTKIELIQMGLFAIFVLPIVLVIITACCPILGIVAIAMSVTAKSKPKDIIVDGGRMPGVRTMYLKERCNLIAKDIKRTVNYIESNIMNIDMIYDTNHGSEQPKTRDSIQSCYKNAREGIDSLKKLIEVLDKLTIPI